MWVFAVKKRRFQIEAYVSSCRKDCNIGLETYFGTFVMSIINREKSLEHIFTCTIYASFPPILLVESRKFFSIYYMFFHNRETSLLSIQSV